MGGGQQSYENFLKKIVDKFYKVCYHYCMGTKQKGLIYGVHYKN